MIELRPATLDDAGAAGELFQARDLADFGEADRPAELIRPWWAREPGASRWLAWIGKRCAGYGRLFDGDAVLAEIHDESCTHPDLESRGVATALFDHMEWVARGKGFERIRATAVNPAGRALLAGRGYTLQEQFWRMEGALREPGEVAEVPPGYRLMPYRPGDDDRTIYDCQVASGDGWHEGQTFELWCHHRHSRPDFDPRGWTVAWRGDELVGGALGFPLGDRAWLLDVFVAPEHRGRGVGLALLRECGARLRALGCSRVGLEVDAGNEAVQIYERAGMHATRRYDVHEKPL